LFVVSPSLELFLRLFFRDVDEVDEVDDLFFAFFFFLSFLFLLSGLLPLDVVLARDPRELRLDDRLLVRLLV
jgi:hypothetical protein